MVSLIIGSKESISVINYSVAPIGLCLVICNMELIGLSYYWWYEAYWSFLLLLVQSVLVSTIGSRDPVG